MARRKLDEDDDVPRLPRGRGLSLSFGQILRIATVAVALLALIVLQKPCAKSVSKFVTQFGPVDAGVARPDGAAAPIMPEGVRIRSDMTPAEIEAAVAQAKAIANANAIDAGVPLLEASVDAR